jgi:hypothetical protein
MVKRICTLVLIATLISSCGNNKKSSADTAVKVEFAALAQNPGDFINKNIKVEGKVVHVCPHTGKKMFIVGENPDIMLYVSAGENTPKFPMDLMGKTISVEGRIERVVTAEKPAEAEVLPVKEKAACCDSASKGKMECADTVKKAAECETEAALAKQNTMADLMLVYSKHEVIN